MEGSGSWARTELSEAQKLRSLPGPQAPSHKLPVLQPNKPRMGTAGATKSRAENPGHPAPVWDWLPCTLELSLFVISLGTANGDPYGKQRPNTQGSRLEGKREKS